MFVPILAAAYIRSTLVLSYHHHASDCLFGAVIGFLTALLGYRSAFRSTFDDRVNWKPRVGRRLKWAIDKEHDMTTDGDEIGMGHYLIVRL